MKIVVVPCYGNGSPANRLKHTIPAQHGCLGI
jgi:hypothetical protein